MSGKKSSLFAQRRAADALKHHGAPSASDARHPNGARLPPIEQVDALVMYERVDERSTHDADHKAPTVTFDKGFPNAVHRDNTQPALGPQCLKSRILALPTPTASSEHLGPIEAHEIHQESLAMIAGMSEQVLKETQQEILEKLDPKLVQILQARALQKYSQSPGTSSPVTTQPSSTTQSGERQKLRWTEDVSNRDQQPKLSDDHDDAGDYQGILQEAKGQPGSNLRFDFTGKLLSDKERNQIPTMEGLHHHGDDPAHAGYSLPEALHLSCSQVPSQRAMALRIMKNILLKLRDEAYPPDDHDNLIKLWHSIHGIIHLHGALDAPQCSVVTEAARALIALLGADPDDPLDDAYQRLQAPVELYHLVVADELPTVEKDKITLQMEADLARLNVAETLVSLDICKFIYTCRNKCVDPVPLLHALYLVCSQSRNACRLVSEDASISQWLFSFMDRAVPVEQHSHIENYLAISIVKRLVQCDHKFLVVHRDQLSNLLHKYLVVLDSRSEVQCLIASSCIDIHLVSCSYGIDLQIDSVLDLLNDLMVGGQWIPETHVYLLAAAVTLHLPEHAVRASVFLELARAAVVQPPDLDDPKQLYKHCAGFRLVGACNVPMPFDAPSLLIALFEAISNHRFPRIPCQERLALNVHPRKSHCKQYLSCSDQAEPSAVQLWVAQVHCWSALLHHTSSAECASRCLEMLKGKQTLPEWCWSWLAPGLSHCLQLSSVDSPFKKALAYICLTCMPVPREATLLSFVDYLRAEGDVAWNELHVLVSQYIQPANRESLYIQVIPRDHQTWLPTILPHNWLIKLLNWHPVPACALLAHVVSWIKTLNADAKCHLSVAAITHPFVAEDFLPFFCNSNAPYLAPQLQAELTMVLRDIHMSPLFAGWRPKCGDDADKKWQIILESLIDAYSNYSYFSPVFQMMIAYSIARSTPPAIAHVLDHLAHALLLGTFAWNFDSREFTPSKHALWPNFRCENICVDHSITLRFQNLRKHLPESSFLWALLTALLAHDHVPCEVGVTNE